MDVIISVATGCVGVLFLATCAVGRFAGQSGWIKRIVLGLAGIMMIHPELMVSLVGFGIAVVLFLLQKATQKIQQPSTANG